MRSFLIRVSIITLKAITSLLSGQLKLMRHNGKTISEYPTAIGWNLVPFPQEKGRPFCADNLATISRHAFLDDDEFVVARKAGEGRWDGSEVRDISWRLDIMLSSISYALRIANKSSIFVECGTGKGYMAAAICKYYRGRMQGVPFYLIDTFEPEVPDEKGSQTSGIRSFVYATGDEEVREYFSVYANVSIIKGRIPEVLAELPQDKKISFLHMDLNSAVAERDALESLKGRLQDGAIVVFDDYGGFGGHDQAMVHESFSRDMGFRLMTLPTGQAIYFHRERPLGC